MEKRVGKILTNWCVITGGPCTGKTTVVNLLKERGYVTTIEHARHYIDTRKQEGDTIEEIRANENEFQIGVLEMQLEEEDSLDPTKLVFLDRALPDAKAYYQFLGLEYDPRLIDAIEKFRYKKIFILDRLPLVNDYARLESEEDQIKIHSLIKNVYAELGHPIVYVPVLPPEERVDFILASLDE